MSPNLHARFPLTEKKHVFKKKKKKKTDFFCQPVQYLDLQHLAVRQSCKRQAEQSWEKIGIWFMSMLHKLQNTGGSQFEICPYHREVHHIEIMMLMHTWTLWTLLTLTNWTQQTQISWRSATGARQALKNTKMCQHLLSNPLSDLIIPISFKPTPQFISQDYFKICTFPDRAADTCVTWLDKAASEQQKTFCNSCHRLSSVDICLLFSSTSGYSSHKHALMGFV